MNYTINKKQSSPLLLSHLQPEAYFVFVEHPTTAYQVIATGSNRVQVKALSGDHCHWYDRIDRPVQRLEVTEMTFDLVDE